MTCNRIVLGFFAMILAFAAASPAQAEFFGCNDTRGKVLYDDSRASYPRHSRHYTNRYTSEFAASPHRRYSQAPATFFGLKLPSFNH